MTNQEYLDAMAKERNLYAERKKNIAMKYLNENLRCKKGDIISGTNGVTIKIERMVPIIQDVAFPLWRFVGRKVKKNGEPYKRDVSEHHIQSNVLLTINGKKI